jgi:hypothetical protein
MSASFFSTIPAIGSPLDAAAVIIAGPGTLVITNAHEIAVFFFADRPAACKVAAGAPLRRLLARPILPCRATRGDWLMALLKAPVRPLLAASALLAGAILGGMPRPASAQGATTALASHRAIYDLKLATTRGKRAMQSVRGRILYDFSGSACEGYALQFRQVSELDSGEGRVIVSDLRATSWEDGAAKRLRFHSQNFFDDNLKDTVDGEAQRENGGVEVKLTEPTEKKLDLKTDLVFPTEHVRRIIAAARQGKTLLQLAVYDGSDTGEKIYDTLTVIGKAIPPSEQKPADAIAKEAAFAKMTRWPVTISYFDRSVAENTGEQQPVYSIGFELYENGVSRALMLDYGDFVLSGEVTSIEMKDAKPCK